MASLCWIQMAVLYFLSAILTLNLLYSFSSERTNIELIKNQITRSSLVYQCRLPCTLEGSKCDSDSKAGAFNRKWVSDYRTAIFFWHRFEWLRCRMCAYSLTHGQAIHGVQHLTACMCHAVIVLLHKIAFVMCQEKEPTQEALTCCKRKQVHLKMVHQVPALNRTRY